MQRYDPKHSQLPQKLSIFLLIRKEEVFILLANSMVFLGISFNSVKRELIHGLIDM